MQYAVFIAIQLVGAFVWPWLLLPSDQVVRSDGTKVVIPKHPTWKWVITYQLPYEYVLTYPTDPNSLDCTRH